MYTEDDTFNQLRQISFDSILRIVVPHCKIGKSVVGTAVRLNLLKNTGWTENEFYSAFTKPENFEIINFAYNNYITMWRN